LVLLVLCAAVLVGTPGLVIDAGYLLLHRWRTQIAAYDGALARPPLW
jgi:hypothetical protein